MITPQRVCAPLKTPKNQTNCGDASFWVKDVPSGYYKDIGYSSRFQTKDALGVWQPDNLVVTIRLQRVEKPIPLMVKRVGDHVNRSRVGHVDGTNTFFRYDLVMGDYLPPDGKGKVADLVVDSKLASQEATNIARRVRTFYDFANTMSFPGRGNGVITAMTRSTDGIKLRTAPENGYGPSVVLHSGAKKKIVPPNVYGVEFSESIPERCYYFRIRSRFDDKGNLVEAYYGKIYGDFKIGCRLREGCSIEFLYYLNPASLDRNLEWDCRTNLCPVPVRIGAPMP